MPTTSVVLVSQDPTFSTGADVSATGCFAVKVNTISGVDSYQIGETITQQIQVNGETKNAWNSYQLR